MKIDVFTPTGEKKRQLELPAGLFEAPVNWGLMHQAVVRQQAGRRASGAHAKTRGEVRGSTKKMYQQKHTGQARRGPIRSPLLRGGGKTFGPRNKQNFTQRMPQKMRHAALRSCLSLQAQQGRILGLESYPEMIKTKDAHTLLAKLPVELGRRILVVLPGKHRGAQMSMRNIPGVKAVLASYLNPEDVLGSRHIIFLVDAFSMAETLFGTKHSKIPTKPMESTSPKKTTRSPSSESSNSSVASASAKKKSPPSKS